MKFAIETIGLTAGGGKELALDLMASLAGHTEHHFTFIVPDLDAYKAISGHNIRTIVCKGGSGLWHRAHLLNYQVPRICREQAVDALLCLGNFVPWKRVCPTSVLLHNAWIVYRDLVAEARRTLREKLITAHARQAYHHLPRDITVITQTQVMKDHLCARYSIASGRVAIVPNTFSLAKTGGDGDRVSSDWNDKAKPFTFLCLAHYYAHKNIEILLDAVLKLSKYTDKSAKCIITIAPEQHPGARRLLERLARGEGAGRIENVGPVSSSMLPELYRSVDALIFPTLLESFSRTYLEAMNFGLPILTSDRDFAHHLCQDAAIYQDPLDADSVARGMARVMEDAGLRQRLVANGRRILAQAPTWDEIATRFVDVLESAALGRPARLSGKTALDTASANDVRRLFNRKAHCWQSKYGLEGKLNFRVEQFTGRLSELCVSPSKILDLGCGTGEIAAAISHGGNTVTACDFAEEMIEVARSNHAGASVQWVCLEPDWKVLPFTDGSFDAIIASSVFEYLVDVPRVAAELAKVLRHEGVLLLTVPNPYNVARQLEAWLRSMPLLQQLLSLAQQKLWVDSGSGSRPKV
jgi:glycosyltransferase involved in cell wall biosynthesis/ubiquinone/menaquinone biosynthesis C-methylase UbiE